MMKILFNSFKKLDQKLNLTNNYYHYWDTNGNLKIYNVSEWSKATFNITGKVKYPDGHIAWMLNGRCHREDGPAFYSPKRGKYNSWCIYGDNITKQVKDWFHNNGWSIKDELDTEEKKLLFRIKFL